MVHKCGIFLMAANVIRCSVLYTIN